MKIDLVFILLFVVFKSNATWPQGQYCLPMSVNQVCPVAWEKGYRYHDLEDNNDDGGGQNRGGHAPYVKIKAGQDLGWGFCCKSRVRYHYATAATAWPKGQYCIFRKGGFCPRAFHEGTIYWDDEDSSNKNNASGTLPDGIYGDNTQMYFCCRDDGPRNLSGLPTCHSLILMRYKGPCPTVSGYQRPYSGYLDWNTEDSRNNDQRLDAHPDGVSKFASGTRIEFCTYRSPWSC